MPPPRTLALELIRDLLAHFDAQQAVLASEEDAHFFRKTAPIALPKPPVVSSALPQAAPTTLAASKNKSLQAAPKQSAVFANPSIAPPLANQKPTAQTSDALSKPAKSLDNLTNVKKEYFRSLFLKIAPEVTTLDDIPSDAAAKTIAERWKTKNQTAPISLLSLSEPPEQKAFLENIAKALNVRFAPCRLVNAETIEKEGRWRDFLSACDLKLIVVCDYTLWQLNKLMTHYKENPTTGWRTLDDVPVFLLPDLSLYLKDPPLKRSLWKALCQKLSS